MWRAALDMHPDAIVVDQVFCAAQIRVLIGAPASGVTVILQMVGDGFAAAVDLLVQLGAARPTMARVLPGGVQRVVLPRLCPACRTRRPLVAEEAAQLGLPADVPVRRAAECLRCRAGCAGRHTVEADSVANFGITLRLARAPSRMRRARP